MWSSVLFSQSFEIFVGNLCKRSTVGFTWLATQELRVQLTVMKLFTGRISPVEMLCLHRLVFL